MMRGRGGVGGVRIPPKNDDVIYEQPLREKKRSNKSRRGSTSHLFGHYQKYLFTIFHLNTGPHDNDIVVMFDSLRMKGEALMELELSA